MDAANAVYSTTFETDEACGTKYHENFVKFWTDVQNNDWGVDGAMTDVKGDRGLSPSKQADPDLFLHVVERTADGVYVTGAKAHQTGYLNSHYVLVMPTISMREGDEDYAISFACPTDADGITLILGRQSCDTRKTEEHNDIDVGNKVYGGHEVLVIFDRVFIPNDMIFLNGETQFAGMMVERFAGYHRQSYGGCKVGVGDVLIGATALAGEMAGSAKASHVKDKLIEMTHLNETLYCCGIACSSQGTKTKSGNYLIDLLLANVCKQNVTRFPYEIARLAQDLAGGIMVTQPSEADYRNPATHDYIEKYLKGVASVSDRGSYAPAAPDREYDDGHRRSRLSAGVHARRRLSAGTAHHDCPSVQHGNEEGTGEEDCSHWLKHKVISVKAAAQEKLWRFHVKNGVCLTGRADPKRSLTDKN